MWKIFVIEKRNNTQKPEKALVRSEDLNLTLQNKMYKENEIKTVRGRANFLLDVF